MLDGALARLQGAGEDREQRRLACAVRADERERLARGHVEIGGLERDVVAVPAGHTARAGADGCNRALRRGSSTGTTGGGFCSISTSTGTGAALVHGSNSTRSREELVHGAPGGEQGQRDEDPGQPVDLPAREQAEDDQERVEAERAPHHLRDDDVALDLVDDEEEDRHPDDRDRVDDDGVDGRRDRAEPGAEVGDRAR